MHFHVYSFFTFYISKFRYPFLFSLSQLYEILTCFQNSIFNSFLPNALFLYPIQTSENLPIFLCFQWVEKGCIGNKSVNTHETIFLKACGTLGRSQILLLYFVGDSPWSQVLHSQVPDPRVLVSLLHHALSPRQTNLLSINCLILIG